MTAKLQPKITEQKMIKLYVEENMTIQNIADIAECTWDTVAKILHKNDVPVGQTFASKYGKEIIRLHNEGYNTTQISLKLSGTKKRYKAVAKYLKQQGIQLTNRKLKTPHSYINDIISMYKSGMTCKEISESNHDVFGCEGSVLRSLKKNGVKLRRTGYKSYTRNNRAFQKINTEEKAYWLGLIMADGCISSNGLGLGLKAEDAYLIEQLKQFLDSDVKTCTTPKKDKVWAISDMKSIRIMDKDLISDLKNAGIHENKTGRECIPKSVPSELLPHFIRGYFDGDGTVFVSNGYLRFGFYGSHTICQEILDYFGFMSNHVFDKPGVSTICIQDRKKVQKFYKTIYKNATIWMKRKKRIFDSVYDNTEVS